MSPALARVWARQPAEYWARIELVAKSLKTDGCSGPARITQWYKRACYEHDVHYRTGKTIFGDEISRYEADLLLSRRIQQMAWDGLDWNPLTWKHVGGFAVATWRYAAVRLFGEGSYKGRINNGKPEPATRSTDAA